MSGGAEAMAYLLGIGAEVVETQQHHQSQETWIGWPCLEVALSLRKHHPAQIELPA